METMDRDEELFTAPVTCTAAYLYSDHGTDLEAIEPFTTELTGIVDAMKEALATEVRILEGTDTPAYTPLDENEQADITLHEEAWRIVSPNGSLRTVHILGSIPGSSSLSSSARPSSPVSLPRDCAERFCEKSIPSSWGISDGCGCAIAVMSESSECTVPMINDPTPGMPSEEK
jgi:hypothetical protein